jgi:histidine ammonia-lyase
VADLAADPLMADVLSRLGRLLAGSDPDRPALQAPVSFRVIPQVLTHLERTLARVEEDIRRALGAVDDSPAFVAGTFVSTGAFHAIDLATDMDVLCLALVQAGELAAQHIHRLLDHRFSGLPDQLTPLPGPHAGLVAVHKRVVGAVNELRRLATPATIGLADTSLGQEDAMTFAYEAAEKLCRAEDLIREILACVLLTARQTWTLRPAPPADGLRSHVAALTDAVPPVDRDRPLGSDIETLTSLLQTGTFASPP